MIEEDKIVFSDIDQSNIFGEINYYKNIISSDINSNDIKYNSCLTIFNLCNQVNYNNAELSTKFIETGIYYLVESYKYNKKRFECVFELIKYYFNREIYEIAFSYYLLIQEEYENNYTNSIETNLNYDFYLPYYIINIGKKLNKDITVIKMFEIIFQRISEEHVLLGTTGVFCKLQESAEENLINNLLSDFNLYSNKINKNNILLFKNYEDYINLLIKNNYQLNYNDLFRKNIKNNFIKIINLERRKDRKENVIKEFNNIGLNEKYYDFIAAVDGNKLAPILELKKLFEGNDFGNRKGVIGCALSHYNLWLKLLKDTENDYYLIFEDDFTLAPNFIEKVNSLLDDFKNRELFFLGNHMYEKNRQNNYNIYNNQDYSRKIELLNQNLYIGGFYSYSINKSGAKKLVDYIQNNGIKYGIDYIIKFIPDLKLYELQPQIVFSEWNENGKKIDSDIQNLYDSIDLNNIISIKNSDDFIFIPYLDQQEYDLYCKKTTLEHYMQIANSDLNCVGFNSFGYFKSYINIHNLFNSPYSKESDGLYVKKNYYEKYKKLIRVKMLCNWCSSEQLCKEWSNMCESNYIWKNIEITWTSENIDYYIIINKPNNNEYYEPSKTIVFQMEPWINDLNKNWGVKTWEIWANPDCNQFLEVRGRNTPHHNNAFWQLELNYNDLLYLKIEKTNIISTICSSKYFDDGHIARIDLLKYIESRNDSNFMIDIYNQDNNHNFKNYKGPVTPYIDKSKGMLSYKYYFMIENNYERNFITEKLWEPILCESLVFYYGCPNVSDYINPLAYILLDINDFEKSYQIIKTAIEEDLWSKRIEIIREEKKKILNHLSFFPTIHNIIINDINLNNTYEIICSETSRIVFPTEEQMTLTKKYCFIHSCYIKEIGLNILQNIIKIFIKNNIIDNFEKIFILNIGDKIDTYIFLHNKIKIINYSDDINKFEIESLNLIKIFCENNDNCKILYLHTKGITHKSNKCIEDWTNMMLYFLLQKSNECAQLLETYDTIGCNYQLEPHKHYSGNFWWANSNYIKTLNKIRSTLRHDAEWWILSNNLVKNYCIHDSKINHYNEEYPVENYIN